MVIIITAYASVESAIEAMKIGAYDYVQKPFKHEELLLTIERALAHKNLREENDRLREELRRKFSFSNILGRSKPMEQVFELIRAAAPTRSTILVQGESGTGKELVARAIHTNSQRSAHPFVVVNSGALPPDLLESHLFGHVKGAFTGAVSEKQGLFEAADKGTIFFDEISTIGLETQAKLLRVMQDREFMRLGGTKTIRVDVRIIAATNVELEEMIEQQSFRKDLYYRLNVIKIVLPPLRERREDIPLLVKHFLDIFAKENGKTIESVSPEVLQLLDRHSWPGNVRELENLIERTVVFAKDPDHHPGESPGAVRFVPRGDAGPCRLRRRSRRPGPQGTDARLPAAADRNGPGQGQRRSKNRGRAPRPEADDPERDDQAPGHSGGKLLSGKDQRKLPGTRRSGFTRNFDGFSVVVNVNVFAAASISSTCRTRRRPSDQDTARGKTIGRPVCFTVILSS